jgi:hypothetical protein
MRSYVIRQLFGPAAAVAVVAALRLGCGAAADDVTLTVGQCIGDNATIGSAEEALIKEDIIEENLLQTKVTKVVCEDMRKPISASTPLQKLVAAQSYIQEIKLIEGAMREAATEQAAREPDWHSSSDDSSMQFGALAYTSELAAAQAQYKYAIGGIEPRELQAAAVARVGEDNDASIATRLRQKEAAAQNTGASVPEARAGARCGTEVEVSDEEGKKSEEGVWEIRPQMPEEMRHRETEQAGLFVSPAARQTFQEMSQKHEAIDEISKSNIGCVDLTNRMKATLVPLEELVIDPYRHDDIRELSPNQETIWNWDVTASRIGEQELLLVLRYEISRKGLKFRPLKEPVYEGAIKVTPLESDSTQRPTERPWWQRIFQAISGIFQAISEWISRLFGA